MEEQVTDVEQEVIITNDNLLFHFNGHNDDWLLLKQFIKWGNAFTSRPSLK